MELYKFYGRGRDNNKLEYYYTNNKEEIKDSIPGGTRIWKPIFIERTEISLDFKTDLLKITVDFNQQPFSNINKFILEKTLNVQIFKRFIVSQNNIRDVYIYNRQIINYEIDVKNQTITLFCNNLSNLFDTKIPKRQFSTGCGFKFKSNECGVSSSAYLSTIYFNEIFLSDDRKSIYFDNSVTISNDYFNNGIINNNSIISNKDNKINVLYPIFDFQLQQWQTQGFITLSAGCNKTMSDCENKFNNIQNFGGFPFIPAKNPTQGL